MTTITYDPIGLSITAEGHAGYAEHGKDIVCAGISALLFALPSALDREHIAKRIESDASKGYVHIKARPHVNYRYMTHTIFMVVIEGLENIQREYPEHLKVTIKETEDD